MTDDTKDHHVREAAAGGKSGANRFFGILLWPLVRLWKVLDRHWLSYLRGAVIKDQDRIYSVRFIWYGDSVYLHPMIWGSLILAGMARTTFFTPGWLLLGWFAVLFVCFLAIMYNFNVVKMAVLGVGLVAAFSLAYVSTVEFSWNPLSAIYGHIAYLEASVSPGFYVASAYMFTFLIGAEVVWAWLFHRVEIDESYVYEHQFLTTSTREPIFARGLRRETKDLLELLLLGAADIRHRTRKGFKRFKNVPFASLWVGTALDRMLDHRRPGQVKLEREAGEHDGEDARLEDAFHGDDDDGNDDGLDDGHDDDGGFDEHDDDSY